MMKKINFKQCVEQKLTVMDNQALMQCLRQIADCVSSEKQEAFIEFLTTASGKETQVSGKRPLSPRMSQTLVDEKLKAIDELMIKLEDGELELEAEGYEDYSDNYWDRDWVWEYSDSQLIGNKIMMALDFAEECMNDCRYEEALSVFDKLLDVEVNVSNDWDDMTIGLEEMKEERIINVNLKQLALLVLYTDYQVQKAERRAEDLYAYFGYSFFEDIRLEEIFCMGREVLEDEARFWQDWIVLLSNKQGEMEARLLKEALLYSEGVDGLARIAGERYEQHPSLYLSALEEYEKNHQYEQMEALGKEAVEKINIKLKIRARIAQKASFAALCIGNEQRMKEYWFEAFRSDTTVSNYLRFFLYDELAHLYGREAKMVLKNIAIGESGGVPGNYETAENIVGSKTCTYLEFFSGEFEKVRKKCVNPKGSLGWSSRFIGTGIRLFLLYLYGDSPLDKAVYGIANDLSGLVDANDYKASGCLRGTELSGNMAKEVDIFWFAFRKWREHFPMKEQDKQQYLLWMEGIVEKRVRAIVGGQFRKHYGGAALLVCALGEVKALAGKEDEKQKLSMKFKKEFPRHSSFHGELRAYGAKI